LRGDKESLDVPRQYILLKAVSALQIDQ